MAPVVASSPQTADLSAVTVHNLVRNVALLRLLSVTAMQHLLLGVDKDSLGSSVTASLRLHARAFRIVTGT